LEFEKQPFTVYVKFDCREPITVEECSVEYNQRGDSRVTMYWYCLPPKRLRPRLKVRVPKDSSLTGEITATFLETPLDIQCEGDNKHFMNRAIITRDLELKPLDESSSSKVTVKDEIVDVGDHRLHCRVFGKGSPVVILISGFILG
jgi:hypothetical protein